MCLRVLISWVKFVPPASPNWNADMKSMVNALFRECTSTGVEESDRDWMRGRKRVVRSLLLLVATCSEDAM